MSANGESVVRVQNLHKYFGALEVLRGVNMDVRTGEVVVIFGRSGSGKSTLLRCINFLEDPTDGLIEVAGIRLEGGHRTRSKREQIRQLRMHAGMVFQQFNLFPHMTALQNVMEGPVTVKGRKAAEVRPIAVELLAKVGLADKADEHPIRLSGGQQQRVAIARALAMGPELMLRAKAVDIQGDRATVEATITAEGKVTATCRGTFVAVKPGHPAYHRW